MKRTENLCVHCVEHPTMKRYYKCNVTGRIQKDLCFAWEHCKNCKPTLRYRFKKWYRTKGIRYDV